MRRERIRRWIDGELDAAEEAALLADAAADPALAALIEDAEAVREALDAIRPAPPPEDLVDQAVLRAVQRRAALAPSNPSWWWGFVRPRTVRVRAVSVLGFVALLGLAFGSALTLRPEVISPPPAESADIASRAAVAIRLALPMEGAQSVAVAGDFNGWDPQALFLEDPDGDGVFVGTLRVEPGSYAYMFVVDGERWVTDPQAPNHVDDGFGNRNAVLRID